MDGRLNGTGIVAPGAGIQAVDPNNLGNPVGPLNIGARLRNQADFSNGGFINQLSNAIVDEVAIYNYPLSSNQVVAHYNAAAEPPVILVQPATPLVVYAGRQATVTVVADGALPLAYQWTVNGVAVSGATNSSYSFFPSVGNNPFFATITNKYGVTNTITGTILVNAYANFNTNGAGWSLNGTGTPTLPTYSNGVLTLTFNLGSSARSSFYAYPQYIGAFKASWIYQVPAGAADGVCFVLQNDVRGTAALGGTGGSLGVSTISPSAELEFNIYNGVPANLGATRGVSYATNGTLTAYDPASAAVMNAAVTGARPPISVNVSYLEGVLSLAMTNTADTSVFFNTNMAIGDLTAIVNYPNPPTNTAYVGFTGSDGGVFSTQTISNFVFVPLPSLSAQLTATNTVLLTWPSVIGGYVVQGKPDLAVPGNWSLLSNPVISINGLNQVIIPPSAAEQFFELIITNVFQN